MHISLVSASIDRLAHAELFKQLNDISVHEASNVECLDKNAPFDLFFFDATLGQKNIAEQILLYQQKKQPIKWVVFNVSDAQQSLQFLQLGALGVLSKLSKKTLQDCFHSISDGQLYLEADLVQILALRQIKRTLLPFDQLTAREFDVFCLLAEDYPIQTIAELLEITTKTAFNCQAQIRKKLNVKNQLQIFKLANKHGLVN